MTWSTFNRVVRLADGRTIHVELAINLDEIARQLGRKAFYNKSGKSRLAIGIKAEANEVKP